MAAVVVVGDGAEGREEEEIGSASIPTRPTLLTIPRPDGLQHHESMTIVQ